MCRNRTQVLLVLLLGHLCFAGKPIAPPNAPALCADLQATLGVPCKGNEFVAPLREILARVDKNGQLQTPSDLELTSLAREILRGVEPDYSTRRFWKEWEVSGPSARLKSATAEVGGTSQIGDLFESMVALASNKVESDPGQSDQLCRAAIVLAAQHRTSFPSLLLARYTGVEQYRKKLDRCLRLDARARARLHQQLHKFYQDMTGPLLGHLQKASDLVNNLAGSPDNVSLSQKVVEGFCDEVRSGWKLADERPDMRIRFAAEIYYVNSLAAQRADNETRTDLKSLTSDLSADTRFEVERGWLHQAIERTDWRPVIRGGPDAGKPSPPN